MSVNEAIYLIRNKERMFKAEARVGEGNSVEYLQDLIDEALNNSKTELTKQVKEKRHSKEVAKSIHEALTTMPVIKKQDSEAVATFPEYTMNELYIHSVAIKVKQ